MTRITDTRCNCPYPAYVADTYTRILIHCVFSTKSRVPTNSEPAELWTDLRGIARNLGADALAIGGTANHVHMLVSLPTAMAVCNLMRDLKANSSRHLNEKRRGFAWQDGYAAISISPSHVQTVKAYIESQEEHHAKWSFESEYATMLEKSGVQRSSEYTFG